MVHGRDLIVAETGARFQLTAAPYSLNKAKHLMRFHFRGPEAFGDEVSSAKRSFTAEERPAINLINRVTPKDTAMQAASTLAMAVAATLWLSCTPQSRRTACRQIVTRKPAHSRARCI